MLWRWPPLVPFLAAAAAALVHWSRAYRDLRGRMGRLGGSPSSERERERERERKRDKGGDEETISAARALGCRPLASAVRSAQDSAAAGVMKTLSGEDVTGEGAKEGKKEREREESLDGPFYGEESESERESVCLARRSAVHARRRSGRWRRKGRRRHRGMKREGDCDRGGGETRVCSPSARLLHPFHTLTHTITLTHTHTHILALTLTLSITHSPFATHPMLLPPLSFSQWPFATPD